MIQPCLHQEIKEIQPARTCCLHVFVQQKLAGLEWCKIASICGVLPQKRRSKPMPFVPSYITKTRSKSDLVQRNYRPLCVFSHVWSAKHGKKQDTPQRLSWPRRHFHVLRKTSSLIWKSDTAQSTASSLLFSPIWNTNFGGNQCQSWSLSLLKGWFWSNLGGNTVSI